MRRQRQRSTLFPCTTLSLTHTHTHTHTHTQTHTHTHADTLQLHGQRYSGRLCKPEQRCRLERDRKTLNALKNKQRPPRPTNQISDTCSGKWSDARRKYSPVRSHPRRPRVCLRREV